ncbi:MAG: hypothetical protein KDE47_08915, partial [Caldilineaceae bacterium]|nr:hypothetical protein [Caldilineaceae bacterium]
ATAKVEILPGQAVDPVLPLVGPRSIVADGAHWTMAVTTPRDRWDNPVAEGTTLTLTAQHPVQPGTAPESGVETIETQTRNLLSWARIDSRTTAGRLLISAQAGDGHSPERTVLEVPGPPVPFTLYANPQSAPADGQSWIQIRSDQITDQFGNVLLDGTQATILAALPPDEIRTVPAITVDGRLYATLQAPTQPGSMFVRAWIGTASSQATQILFTPGPAVQTIPVSVTWQADTVSITAGPLVGERGQFVPDGTEVTFTLSAVDKLTANRTTATAHQTIVPVEYGYATLVVRTLTLTPGTYAITVAAGTGKGSGTFAVVAESAAEQERTTP